MLVDRRRFFALIGLARGALAAGDNLGVRASSRGVLARTPEGVPALRSGGQLTPLTGDQETLLVLQDERLAGLDFEVLGRPRPGGFLVDPIHTRALLVHQNGKRLAVTYWCDICYIRTYSPGKCWCCQQPTRPDFVEPASLDH